MPGQDLDQRQKESTVFGRPVVNKTPDFLLVLAIRRYFRLIWFLIPDSASDCQPYFLYLDIMAKEASHMITMSNLSAMTPWDLSIWTRARILYLKWGSNCSM